MKLRIDAPRPVLELVALFMELNALAVELLFNHLSGGRKGVRRSDVVRGKMRGGDARTVRRAFSPPRQCYGRRAARGVNCSVDWVTSQGRAAVPLSGVTRRVHRLKGAKDVDLRGLVGAKDEDVDFSKGGKGWGRSRAKVRTSSSLSIRTR
jgi:hypothetical protein